MQIELDERLKAKLNSGREFRMTQDFEIRKPKEGEEQKKIVRGYATTFNQEYLLYDWGDYKVFEQVDRHAFDECDMSDVIMQYDHMGRVFARNKNGTLQLGPDDIGLGIEADLSGTDLGGQVYEEIKGGYTTKMSMAFTVGEDERTVKENKETNVVEVHRKITKVKKLFDVSAVSYPANDMTSISARQFSEGVIEELKQERLRAKAEAREAQIAKLRLRIRTIMEE